MRRKKRKIRRRHQQDEQFKAADLEEKNGLLLSYVWIIINKNALRLFTERLFT